jgi:hypothetical protein
MITFVALLFAGCSKKPGSVVADFYKAKTWEERKAFILDANGLKEKDVYDEESDYNVQDVNIVKKIDESSAVYKVTIMRKKDGIDKKEVRKFLLTKVGSDEKIDFKTMIGFNDISYKTYMERDFRHNKPAKFWMIAYTSNDHGYRTVHVQAVGDAYNPDEAIYLPYENCPDNLQKFYDYVSKHRGAICLVEVTPRPGMSEAELTFGHYFNFVKPSILEEE